MQGWAASLQYYYSRKLDIVNRGQSGYNTEWSKHLISDIIDTCKKDGSKLELSVVFLGANDAANREMNSHQGIELAQFKANLKEISLKIIPHSRLLLVTPPPIDGPGWAASGINRRADRTMHGTVKYRNAVLELGAELNVPVLDVFKAFLGESCLFDQGKMNKLFFDGLHFDVEGNQTFYKALIQEITANWPELDTERLVPPYALWHDILLIGDSITQCGSDPSMMGWTASLQHHYIRKLEIVNKGLSGYNTEWVKPLADEMLEYCELGGSKIELTIIFLGANDAVNPTVNSLQPVDLESYKSNLTEICTKAQRKGRVLLVTPPPANQSPERIFERTRNYKNAAKQSSQDLNVPCLDTWTGFLGPDCDFNETVFVKYFYDGVHFNTEGNKLFYSLIIEKIYKTWPELHLDQICQQYAEWDQVAELNQKRNC
ncbi:hypothetical protein HDV06_005692 [Boothiomyces sp. JEL0866]|nr:hypothetical protein HDV06_005692 [Boothiomyces sp. JEL0866]